MQDEHPPRETATYLQVLHPVLTLGLLVLTRLDLIAKLTGTQPRPAPGLLSGEVRLLLELRGCREVIVEGYDQAVHAQLLGWTPCEGNVQVWIVFGELLL
jgi:hypothetical protein